MDLLRRLLSGLRTSGSRRAYWAVANEGLDAASNLFLSVWIARSVAASEFGAFGLVYAAAQLGTMLGRSSANMPMMIAYGGSNARFRKSVAGDTLGASLAVGLGLAAFLLGLGFADGPIRSVSLAMAAVVPGLLLQDCCVYLFYSRQRPKAALANNAIWASVQVLLFCSATYLYDSRSAWVFVALWGMAAYVAVGASLVHLGVLPRLTRAPRWWRRHRSVIADLVGETFLGQMAQQGIVWILAIRLSLSSLGGFRAAQVPFGVLRVFIQGLVPIGVAEGARLRQERPHLLLRLTQVWAAAGAVLAGLFGAALLAIPEDLGRQVLGQSWLHARPILLPVIVAAAANTVVVPAQAGLRSLDATRVSVKLRVPLALLQLLGVLAGAIMGGLSGAAIGFAVSSVLGATLAMVVFHRTFAARLSAAPKHSSDAPLR